MMSTIPVCLTIAGSDSIGGAGLQADLKTFEHFGVYGTSVVTLITAQNTQGVHAVAVMNRELVRSQLSAVLDDVVPRGVKTGALGDAENIRLVAEVLRERGAENLVVDPVMVSKHGHRLIDDAAIACLMERLCPLATILTPNIPEAAVMVGRPLNSSESVGEAAKELARRFATSTLVTGGSLDGNEAIDVLATADGSVREFRSPMQTTHNTHGTGCTMSAAICALLARGEPLEQAVERAKHYIDAALAASPDVGKGIGPLRHHLS